MAKRIHFEDDIFYLNLLVRAFRDGLELDLDTELFLTKTIDDIAFIDASFERLLAELNGNERYIERGEQMLNLLESEERFSEALGRVQAGRGTLAEALAPFAEKLSEYKTKSLDRRTAIDGAVASRVVPEDDPYVVSQIELNELLKGSED